MKNKSRIIFIASIPLVILMYYNLYKGNKKTNEARCEILYEEVVGVVEKKSGAKEPSYYIDNKDEWYVMVFDYPYNCQSIEIGDSIIKKANDNKVQIIRNGEKCIGYLSCDD